MTTKRIAQPMYLDADRAALLDELSRETRVPKAVFIREAIEDLLIKHEKLKPPKRRP